METNAHLPLMMILCTLQELCIFVRSAFKENLTKVFIAQNVLLLRESVSPFCFRWEFLLAWKKQICKGFSTSSVSDGILSMVGLFFLFDIKNRFFFTLKVVKIIKHFINWGSRLEALKMNPLDYFCLWRRWQRWSWLAIVSQSVYKKIMFFISFLNYNKYQGLACGKTCNSHFYIKFVPKHKVGEFKHGIFDF